MHLEVSSIFSCVAPRPAWQWPRTLTEWETRDMELRWDPNVQVISGYRAGDTVHYVMRFPSSHGGKRWRVALNDDGRVRLTPHTA